jgi:hypothetical protein
MSQLAPIDLVELDSVTGGTRHKHKHHKPPHPYGDDPPPRPLRPGMLPP